MMGKRAAETMARSETLTWGRLREIVEATCDRSAVCPINPQLTMGYCQDLYLEITSNRDATEIPEAWRTDVYSHRAGAVKPSRDFLQVANLLRIFGPPRDAS